MRGCGRRVSALAIVLLFVALRAADLEADPPLALAGSYERAQDFWLEPPAKAHEARNWALFGQWRTNAADRYQFWRRQSPLWVYPLAGAFSVLGVSYCTLRGFSLAVAVAGFLLALVLARERYRGVALAAFGVCLSLSFHSILLDRSGLVEVMVSTFIVAMVVCLYYADRHPAWLLGSQACFTAAFFAKQGAVLVFPLFVVANVLAFRRQRRDPRHPPWLRWLPVASAMSIAVVTAACVLQPGYQRTVSWNYQHLMFATNHPSVLDYMGAIAERLGTVDRYLHHWVVPFPVVGTLAIAALARTLLRGVVCGTWTRWDALVAAWSSSCWLALLLIRQTDVRFTAVLVLPTFLLFGSAVADALRWTRARSRRSPVAVALGSALVAAIALDVARYSRWVGSRGHQLQDAGRALRHAIGDCDAVIVGRFSAPVVLETPHVHYYVKWGFNTDAETIRALGVTHAVWHRYDEETRIHFGRLDGRVPRHEWLVSIPFRQDVLDLVVLGSGTSTCPTTSGP